MSSEPLARPQADIDAADRGLLLAVLVMVLLGAAAMLLMA